MSKVELIQRRKKLEKQIEELEKAETMLSQIRGNCEHEIVVNTYRWTPTNIEAQCIFCGKKFEDNSSIRDIEEIIDMTQYTYMTASEKYKVVEEAYNKIAKTNPEFTEKEIAEIIKKWMCENSDEFKELLKFVQND